MAEKKKEKKHWKKPEIIRSLTEKELEAEMKGKDFEGLGTSNFDSVPTGVRG